MKKSFLPCYNRKNRYEKAGFRHEQCFLYEYALRAVRSLAAPDRAGPDQGAVSGLFRLRPFLQDQRPAGAARPDTD